MTGLYELADAISGPDSAFDRSYILPIPDPGDAHEVLDTLARQGGRTVELVLFYYAGHGLRGPGDSLCLGLPESAPAEGAVQRTSLQARDLFAVMERLHATYKVAILDCCFSGLAFDIPSATGIHLLTATNKTSKARSDQERTAFTRELLRLLRTGIPDGPPYLDLATIYRRLAILLPASFPKRYPVPWQRSVNWTGDLRLARNAAHGTGRTLEGLRARARFAEHMSSLRSRVPDPARTAIELLEGVVADAVLEYPAEHDTVHFRHLHASLVGQAGDAREATEMLEALIQELSSVSPDHSALEALKGSREHWRRQSP